MIMVPLDLLKCRSHSLGIGWIFSHVLVLGEPFVAGVVFVQVSRDVLACSIYIAMKYMVLFSSYVQLLQLGPFMSYNCYNWLFLWDSTFYNLGVVNPYILHNL